MTEVLTQSAAQPATDEKIPLDRLVKMYRKVRDQLGELTTKYETEKAQLEEVRDAFGSEMKDRLREMGLKSAKTEYGTVSLGETRRYYTDDWDPFKEFVLQYGAIDLLEKRIAQTNMETFLKNNPGVMPPGLNIKAEVTVSVRKPNEK